MVLHGLPGSNRSIAAIALFIVVGGSPLFCVKPAAPWQDGSRSGQFMTPLHRLTGQTWFGTFTRGGVYPI